MKNEARPLAPHDDDGPLFDEPWQADVFALSEALVENGRVSGAEWMSALADAITRHQAEGDPDLGNTYYEHCLAALEDLCAEKGLTSAEDVDTRTEEWRLAYVNTPHGDPVELSTGQAPPAHS